MTEQQDDERDIETIVPAPGPTDPGTQDGVGERVLSGQGSEGVEHLEGEFGHLEQALDSGSDVLAPEGATEPTEQS